METQRKYKETACLRRRSENRSDQVVTGFSFAFDWLRGWPKFSEPITECDKVNVMRLKLLL